MKTPHFRLYCFLSALLLLIAIPTVGFAISYSTYYDYEHVWPIEGHFTYSQNFATHKYKAVDIAPASGTPIHAAASGYVYKYYYGCKNWNARNGTSCKALGKCTPNADKSYAKGNYCNYGFGIGLTIKGDNGLYYQYAHMSSVEAAFRKTGTSVRVEKGDIIGYVGSTGASGGPHLHFEVNSENEWEGHVNPEYYGGYLKYKPYTNIAKRQLTFKVVANGNHKLVSVKAPYSADGGVPVVTRYQPGDIVTTVQVGTNMYNNVWYRLANGSFVWDGVLQYVGSAAEIKSSTPVDMTLTVVAHATQPMYENRVPFGTWIQPVQHQAGDTVHAVQKLINSAGSTWYLLDSGKYMWSGVLSEAPVTPPEVTGIETADAVNLTVGEKAAIKYSLIPPAAADPGVSFTSSDASVCAVDAGGMLTPFKPGSCTVTLRTGNGVTAMVQVNVSHNILTETILLDGTSNANSQQVIDLVESGTAVSSTYTYTLSNSTDPGYDVVWSAANASHTAGILPPTSSTSVTFNGCGLVFTRYTTPKGTQDWNTVLVTDPSRSAYIPAGTRIIEEYAFRNTAAVIFYVPDTVQSIGDYAFPDGSILFINTHVTDTTYLGFDYTIIETGPSYNEAFQQYMENESDYYVLKGTALPSKWGEWSAWTTEYRSPDDNCQVESALQYSWRDSITTPTYSSWSNWSPYSKSRQTIANSSLKEERSATVWPYYYFLCASCGQHSPQHSITCLADGCSAKIQQGSWTEYWLAINPASLTGENARWYSLAFKWTVDSHYGTSFQNKNSTDYPSGTGYSYRTRQLNHVVTWGDWSTWSFESTEASSTREVQTRTVYRWRTRH